MGRARPQGPGDHRISIPMPPIRIPAKPAVNTLLDPTRRSSRVQAKDPAMMAEACLLGQLTDPDLRDLAIAKMEGNTSQEIAQRFGCSVRAIERRPRLVRKTWKEERLQ